MFDSSMWELKEAAKWSSNGQEKKEAITKLSARGPEALSSLQEILDVTAYEDVKAACVEAIKSINGKEKQDKG
jgi:hypothetical protein